jgi:hypothetical protein
MAQSIDMDKQRTVVASFMDDLGGGAALGFDRLNST